MELCRYVVLNPVRARLVARASDWPWSSYGATARRARTVGPVTIGWILGQFADDPRTARRRYREFVAAGGETYRPWDQIRGGAVLGTEEFHAALAKRLGGPAHGVATEVPRRERHVGRPRLEDLRAGATDRGAWMSAAYRDHGYTMVEIAEAAGLHYSSVSKIIKAHE